MAALNVGADACIRLRVDASIDPYNVHPKVPFAQGSLFYFAFFTHLCYNAYKTHKGETRS